MHAFAGDARQKKQQEQRDMDDVDRLVPIFKALLCMVPDTEVVKALVGLGLVQALAEILQHKILEPLLRSGVQDNLQSPRPQPSKAEALALALAILERCCCCWVGRCALVQHKVTYTIMAEINLQVASVIPEGAASSGVAAVLEHLLRFCERLEAACLEPIQTFGSELDSSAAVGHEVCAEDATSNFVKLPKDLSFQSKEVDDVLLQGSQDLRSVLRRVIPHHHQSAHADSSTCESLSSKPQVRTF